MRNLLIIEACAEHYIAEQEREREREAADRERAELLKRRVKGLA